MICYLPLMQELNSNLKIHTTGETCVKSTIDMPPLCQCSLSMHGCYKIRLSKNNYTVYGD